MSQFRHSALSQWGASESGCWFRTPLGAGGATLAEL